MLPNSYQPAAALLLVVGGIIACFAGYRLFRTVLAIYGFILGALGAMVLQRYIIVVGTALVGAWTLIIGVLTLLADRSEARSGAAGTAWILYPFAPAPGQRWLPLAFVALGAVGMVVQLGVTGRKRVAA